MSWDDEGTFSSLGAFPLCLCSFNAPSKSEAGRNLWRILLFLKFGIAIWSLSVPTLIRPETSFREIGFVAYSTVISKCIGCPARRIPIFHTWVAPFSSFRARREHRLVSVRSSIDDRHSGNDPSWYVNACDLHCIQVLTRNYTFPIGLAGPDWVCWQLKSWLRRERFDTKQFRLRRYSQTARP